MIYEVRATLFFNTLTAPDQIKQALLQVWSHAQVINPGTPEQECSTMDVIECHHDEHPPQPCHAIFHRDNCPP